MNSKYQHERKGRFPNHGVKFQICCHPSPESFLSLLRFCHSVRVCHLHLSRNKQCTVGTLHTGTHQCHLFHEGSTVDSLYLCFCLAALTSPRSDKLSKPKIKGGITFVWQGTSGLPTSHTHSLHECVCACTSASIRIFRNAPTRLFTTIIFT